MRTTSTITLLVGGALAACSTGADSDIVNEREVPGLPSASAVAAAATSCGTAELDVATRARVEAELAAWRARGGPASATSGTIRVYFHRIHAGDGTGGEVTDAQLAEQVRVLNESFGGFEFVLAGVTDSNEEAWYVCYGGGCENEMKATLHAGAGEDLNIYTSNILPLGLLGWSSFPSSYHAQPTQDGVVLHYQAMPGGALAGYNAGKIGVHETGHWAGLYHTFQGGCNPQGSQGDGVDDTPASRVAARGCPVGLDSCAGDHYPGLDPIHNFMNYTENDCMFEFTPGQEDRMQAAWDTYRVGP